MGINMSLAVQRVRYPPFEHRHMEPSAVPIVEAVVEMGEIPNPEFIIGAEDDWIVEWRGYSDDDAGISRVDSSVGIDIPNFIRRSRIGWYIAPDPLHNISRKLIAPTVILLILSLFIHAIEPGLVEWGFLTNSIAGSFRLGPLEYPKLLMFAFPVFLMPLLFRMIANLRDLSRQKALIRAGRNRPDFSVEVNLNSVEVSAAESFEGLRLVRSRVQVGIAVPERRSVLAVLRRSEGRQPSPGMSTKLTQKRVASGDYDGTGVGESTPMVVPNTRAAVLEPMRIMSSGRWCEYSADPKKFILDCPENWPGSIYSSLIAVHWEVMLEFSDNDGNLIKWVEPVIINQRDAKTVLSPAPTRSGRAELANF